MSKSIAALPMHARPREKLLAHGVAHLTDAELLAVILGSGTRKQNVLKLSEKVLKPGLRVVAESTVERLQKIKGIGTVRATKILACAELGVWLGQPDPQLIVRSTKDAARLCHQLLRHKQTEHVGVIGLNARNHLTTQAIVAIGTANAAQLHPRDVFSPVLQHPSTSLILTHNHPSGDCSPSEDDFQCTKKIQSVGEALGVELIDHVIVSRDKYFSFRESELL